MLVEIGCDNSGQHDPEIELARVESTDIADFGLQLIKLDPPTQVNNQTFRWAILEAIWNRRGDMVVRGRSAVQQRGRAAKRVFEELARRISGDLAGDLLLERCEPTRRQEVAETGKWQALKDVHPKTVGAIERASLASEPKERKRHLHTAADEFGKEFYALRKQNVWPKKQNVTAAIAPLDKVPAAQRKSLGRRKPSPNLPNRYMATCWILKGLADMSAAQLADHLNRHFNTSFTASQVRTKRKRLQLFVDWEDGPRRKA